MATRYVGRLASLVFISFMLAACEQNYGVQLSGQNGANSLASSVSPASQPDSSSSGCTDNSGPGMCNGSGMGSNDGGGLVVPDPNPHPSMSPLPPVPEPSCSPKPEPSESSKSVSGHIILNVSDVEILEDSGSGAQGVLFDKNLGKVDLYTEAPKLLADAKAAVGTDVIHVRLHVNASGNSVVDDNGKVLCDLNVPSGQLLFQFVPFTVHAGVQYSIQIMDTFYHPVTDHCMLRPVANSDIQQK